MFPSEMSILEFNCELRRTAVEWEAMAFANRRTNSSCYGQTKNSKCFLQFYPYKNGRNQIMVIGCITFRLYKL